MRRSLLLAGLVVAVSGAGADTVAPADSLPVAPGSQGVCITEMDGGERVEVPVTVLGTIGPSAPEAEMVLVRLDDPRFVKTGIIAGMSGSPVYVDGELLGALAFGWAFAKDPIGGVTPFARMRQLPVSTTAGPSAPGGAAPRPQLQEIHRAGRSGNLGEKLVEWLLPVRRDGLQHLPVAVSTGASSTIVDCAWLAEGWRRLGWLSVPSGGAGPVEGLHDLQPGDMVAGILVTGDATVAAAGTVTEVDGDQVWAFGHPFLGGGHLALPMARASVVAVLPSQLSSFKFFDVGEVVGALEVDRTHGVWGRLGRSVTLVPVDVEVHGRSYHFESVRHPVLLPLMVAYVTHSSYAARGRTFGEQTVGLRIEVVYAGGHEAVVEETYASDDAAARAAALSSALVAYLEGSPFTAPVVERVQVQLRAAERYERAEIVDAIADRSVVRPGETVNVRIRLRRFRGDMVERRMQIVVPRELPAGRVDVVVADGASWTAYDMQMRPLRPASFDDELQLVGRLIPSTRLVLALERREVGVVVPGGSMAAPPSVVVTLRSGLGPNLETTTHRVVHVVEEAMAVPVLGAQRIPLLVRQDGETGRSKSPAAAAP